MADKNYITAVGRRKTAVARVRLTPAKDVSVTVNGMPARDYFKTDTRDLIAREALTSIELGETYAVEAKVMGGGIAAQADAVRHGVARALIKAETGSRAPLKKAGFLTRDPRAKERKKPGLRKARKRPQWSKR